MIKGETAVVGSMSDESDAVEETETVEDDASEPEAEGLQDGEFVRIAYTARTVEDDKDAFTDDMVTFDVDFDGARVISRYICSDCYTSDNHLTLEAQA
jgi:hypothetical protein